MIETKPRPSSRASKKTGGAWIGAPQYRRYLSPSEVEEVREREATVTADGIREITMVKGDDNMNGSSDRSIVRDMVKKGYDVDDSDPYDYVFRMPQKKYLEQDAARIQISEDRRQPPKKLPKGQVQEFRLAVQERLMPLSADDIAKGHFPEIQGGNSVSEVLAEMGLSENSDD